MKRLLKVFFILLSVVVFLAVAVYIAFQVSPWPSALLIRSDFEKDAAHKSQALEKYVPAGIATKENIHYRPNDKDAYLDVYYPEKKVKSRPTLPTVVWVHGGGWISGQKSNIRNYLKILAGKGYTTVSVGYTIAPEKQYPTPVIQANEALGYISTHAKELHIDKNQLVLAGDSAGSQIVSQVAALTTSQDYAQLLGIYPALEKEQLKGMLLNCGAYDIKIVDANGDSEGAKLLKAFLWSYSGRKDFTKDPEFMEASVIDHVTSAFPPSFITAGNDDPLLSQSTAMAQKLSSLGVETDTLFYPKNYQPALPHEYQFTLDTTAGKTALERMGLFLENHTH